jgi:alkaline phosphatase D
VQVACALPEAGTLWTVDRRRFLQFGTAAGLASVAGAGPLAAFARGTLPLARSVASGRSYAPVGAFPSGVLSGDPTSDGVVLWTRIDPMVAGAGVTVDWEVASDPGFAPASLLAGGSATTSPAAGHTVKVEADGLGAGTTAWYRFVVAGVASPVGRTKTLPAGSIDRLRVAFFSCQRYVHGYYTAHADLAEQALDPATDLDLVVSLGDYIYESGPADDVTVDGREDPRQSQVSLEDYRRQYERYRSDLNLQAVHAAFPLVAIFDNHDGMTDPFDASGPGAVAAFFEQMPVRPFATSPTRQHRSFRLGDLAELFLLDERQHRDRQPPQDANPLGTSTREDAAMMDEERTMLGADQRQWLEDGLRGSDAAWKLIGSQLMFGPLRSQRFAEDIATAGGSGPNANAGRYVNLTQWDGYQAERRRILRRLHEAGVRDVVVVAGDTHFWTASELPLDFDDPDAPLVLTEFGGTSISSANAGEMRDLPGNELIRPVVAQANPYSLRYIEVTTHGYGVVDLDATRARVTYRIATSITRPEAPSVDLAVFEVQRGTARIEQVAGSDFLARPSPPIEAPDGPADPAAGTPPAPMAAPAQPVAGTPRLTG